MQKLITILTLLLISQVLFAQAPQATSYQAVIRNSSGNVLSNQLVKVRFSIRDSAANGTVVYQETQTPTTNAQGLINLFAGKGTATVGTFAGINWGNKSKFLQAEIDIAGGNNYTDMGTMQLMSVPYALYSNVANTAISATTATTAANGNPNGTAVGEMLYWNGTSWVKLNPGTNGQNLTFCNGVPQWGPCLILPTVLTGSITAKTAITATAGGNVTDSGSRAITARGVCFSTTINPTIANTKTASGTNVIGAFTVSLTGLSASTTYHYRAYATTSVGTSYGADSVFTTNAATIPTLTTTAASAISVNTATSGGNITSDNGATITARGICWSATANPTIALTTKTINGTGTGTFTSSITGLTANTTYYVRAYATNSVGTAYGTQVSFTTASAVANLPRVTIGTQVWSSKNLDVVRYRNGDIIPQVTDSIQWRNLTTGAWCWYDNDSATYAATYGRLYNWYAVNDARGLAPQGWHVPSDAEWTILEGYLGGSSVAGGAMKSITGWNEPNTGATNSSGFTALPGGYRFDRGQYFGFIGFYGYWWSSTTREDILNHVWFRYLNNNNSNVWRASGDNLEGYSVRCLRDTTIMPLNPSITTAASTNITSTSTTSGGNITSDGGATITARGICWSTTANPSIALNTKTVDGTGAGAFTSSIIGLTANTTYYVRAYATNSLGTFYGMQLTFTTLPVSIPILTTTFPTNITTTATSGGNITSDNGATITARGVCWSTTANPTIALSTKTIDGTGTGAFTSSITGLIANNIYYVKAYATNSAGTAYGTQQTFTTANAVANLPRVTIGTQVWSSKNLDVAKYRNGDPIPQVTDQTQWEGLTTGAWCWYNNDSATYAATYGRLYNWYAVNNPRGLAPQGYHIPTDAEWNKLVKYLDAGADTTCSGCSQSSIAGGAMKSTSGWYAPNTGAANSSGFAGLPGGYRYDDGSLFGAIGFIGYWWSSTENGTADAWYRKMSHSNSDVTRVRSSKSLGLSVRCVRDTTITITPTTPILTTKTLTNITTTTTTSGGNITSDGGATITTKGVCWSTTANPTISLNSKTIDGTGTGTFTSSITGLIPNTTYYVRAYATNSVGTSYGIQQTFTASSAGSTILPNVAIGTQVWTTQNLSVARYRNGDIIPQVTDPTQWAALTTGAWCWYNNDSATYASTYGRLYNWYAVNDARGLAPQGYHIPSDGEWNKLVKYLDARADTTCQGCTQSEIAGGAMKSTIGWNAPNRGATNSSGFVGLPGGFRDNGAFNYIGDDGNWWSSAENNTSNAWSRHLSYFGSYVFRLNYDKQWGFSVRCVRD